MCYILTERKWGFKILQFSSEVIAYYLIFSVKIEELSMKMRDFVYAVTISSTSVDSHRTMIRKLR